jgi:hypothetical protein
VISDKEGLGYNTIVVTAQLRGKFKDISENKSMCKFTILHLLKGKKIIHE